MSDIRVRSANDRRRDMRLAAGRLGVDEAYISTLVETFYDRVRSDPGLGPIFARAIPGDWGPHLAKMKDFWASVALGDIRYDGRPVPAHQKLSDLKPPHFAVWLALFHQTLRDTAPSPEAVDFFMEKARRIAQSLEFAISGVPPILKERRT
uniref:group III truncated hemoglobin n=1 Tax=Stappia sp. TaxID=1870903 RepID=UPI003BAAB68C